MKQFRKITVTFALTLFSIVVTAQVSDKLSVDARMMLEKTTSSVAAARSMTDSPLPPDFGDTSPKQSFVFQFSSHSRTPLREHSQIRDFSASPKSTLPKHKNALFIGVSEDWYSAKC